MGYQVNMDQSTTIIAHRIYEDVSLVGDVEDRYLRQLPRATDSTTLMFSLRFPSPPPGHTLSVADARLRLFKTPVEDVSANDVLAGGPAAAPADGDNCPSENRYRITVSWLQLKSRHYQGKFRNIIFRECSDVSTTMTFLTSLSKLVPLCT